MASKVERMGNAAKLRVLTKSAGAGGAELSKCSTKCPKCGTDVMVTGFTTRADVTRSYMRFAKSGVVQIASSQAIEDRAECMVCGARLEAAPVDLMRLP